MPAIPTQTDRCGRFLESYLRSVADALTASGCTVRESTVSLPGNHEALGAVLVFSPPLESRTVRAGWHEELGWWAEPCGQTSRRYLRTALVPAHTEVADFLTHVSELGSPAPTLHRYRLLNPDLAEQLERVSQSYAEWRGVQVGAPQGGRVAGPAVGPVAPTTPRGAYLDATTPAEWVERHALAHPVGGVRA